jgi:hypothetical protein
MANGWLAAIVFLKNAFAEAGEEGCGGRDFNHVPGGRELLLRLDEAMVMGVCRVRIVSLGSATRSTTQALVRTLDNEPLSMASEVDVGCVSMRESERQ